MIDPDLDLIARLRAEDEARSTAAFILAFALLSGVVIAAATLVSNVLHIQWW